MAAAQLDLSPNRSSIQINLPLSKQAAFEKTLAAFSAEGFVIAINAPEAGIIGTVPRVQQSGVARISLVYHATIVANSDTSVTVLLAGTFAVRDAGGFLSV